MADALLSPAVGGGLWGISAAAVGYASRRLRRGGDDRLVPFMGVMGACVFAAQMINFTIPGTGSSGHLGGGLLLAALLGPSAALVVMASILLIQAVLFADGGILALGANMFNLGIIPAFIAYPLVYRPLARRGHLTAAAVAGSVMALSGGALGVVLQTTASGISELPFIPFLAAMLPIHVAIGVVEGLVTASLLRTIRSVRGDLLPEAAVAPAGSPLFSFRALLLSLLAVALLTGGFFSRYASALPDGLEWSVARVSGSTEGPGHTGLLHQQLQRLQQQAPLPEYGFRSDSGHAADATPLAGVVGGMATLCLAAGLTFALRFRQRRSG